MNAAQIHLALNHAPLFFSIAGGSILILGMIKKNDTLKSLSLYLLVAAAIFTIPVFLTGEGTEEMVENLPGVTESAIEKHQDMAKISLAVIVATGVISLIGLFLRKKSGTTRYFFIFAILLSLVSFGTMAQTAHLGGLIRHAELQSGASSGANENDNEAEGNEEANKNNKITPQEGQSIKDSLNQSEKAVNKKNDDD